MSLRLIEYSQTVNMGGEGSIVEERQGKNLVNSALKHGVQHFVYASCARHGDQATDVPHFASKHHVEHHLIDSTRGGPMSWTILRPVAFMENLDGGFLGTVFATGWRNTIKSRRLQLIATTDIGVVGAKAFLDREKFSNQVVDLAGDELSFADMARIYKEVTGSQVPTTFGFVVTVIFWLSSELRLMFNFFDREGFGVDMAKSKEVLPEIQDFRTWLSSQSKTA